MEKFNVLILGSGGRENALAWKVAQSPLLRKLFIAPGNAGTEEFGMNISLHVSDFQAIKKVVIDNNIDMVIVGPEEPLVKGISDFFHADPILNNVLIFGPESKGAALEGSKDFAKQFMIRHGIPTALSKTFSLGNINEASDFLQCLQAPFVLKADGLAAGKGVVICPTLQEALKELNEMIVNKRFGSASDLVVIEEFLTGIELSVFAITDGANYLILPEAKDYKRIGENDSGPNTGGMGSVSPVPFADATFMKKVEDRVIKPTIEGLKKDGIPYCGFIFFGLMNVEGNPLVIEYNVRLGDPETEVILPRIKSDLLDILTSTVKLKLQGKSLVIDNHSYTCIMTVSGGYPEDYSKGFPITISKSNNQILYFHAGTSSDIKTNTVLTTGGRVLAIVASGEDLNIATHNAYQGVKGINFDKMYYRPDIGKDLINIENTGQ